MNKLDTATKKLISDPTKRRAWVKYQIQMQGRSMAQVGADANMDRRNLYSAFHKPYPRAEKIISEAVGLTPQELFPERYDADGLPNRRMGRPPVLINHVNTSNDNTSVTRRNVHKSGTA